MKYFKQYKEIGAEEIEITKEKAKELLTGYWKKEMIKDIFENNKSFRLFTPFSIIWTQDENGLIPIAGFYGICE